MELYKPRDNPHFIQGSDVSGAEAKMKAQEEGPKGDQLVKHNILCCAYAGPTSINVPAS